MALKISVAPVPNKLRIELHLDPLQGPAGCSSWEALPLPSAAAHLNLRTTPRQSIFESPRKFMGMAKSAGLSLSLPLQFSGQRLLDFTNQRRGAADGQMHLFPFKGTLMDDHARFDRRQR